MSEQAEPRTDTQHAQLLLGPVLRRVTDTTASIWVETSGPASVEVTAAPGNGQARTFAAFGHHYALVLVTGLTPDADVPYQVMVDGRVVWPATDPGMPPSRIRTRGASGDEPVRVVFGSCREGAPTPDDIYPPDALDTFARLYTASGCDPAGRPDLLLLLGDQVYADEVSESTRRFLHRRRRFSDGVTSHTPGDEVKDFEEYTHLYYESWRDPEIRWLLSTVPTMMIFDDHEIIDDWNTSAAWREQIREVPWWQCRITGGIASYWVYQHLGNLSPDELRSDPTVTAILGADDATSLLEQLALTADRSADPGGAQDAAPGSDDTADTDTGRDGITAPDSVAAPALEQPTDGSVPARLNGHPHPSRRRRDPGPRWSYRLDVARTRLIVLDNRAGRVLTPGHRQMLRDADWNWLAEQVSGDYDHLVIGASLPWLLPHAIHELESWNERLCDSPRPLVAAGGEWLRQFADMEHWPAFRTSFERLGRLLYDVARGRRTTRPPASITVLSGDVHHSYVAEAALGPDQVSRIYQLTCSPTHNQAPPEMKVGFHIGWNRGAVAIGSGLARLAGVPRPEPSWWRRSGPFFNNAIGTLELTGRAARVRLDGTERGPAHEPRLRPLSQVPLAWRSDDRARRSTAAATRTEPADDGYGVVRNRGG
ncbi:MAG: alkaline phosphatase D family protein [Actinocatenispora sp.]